MKYRSEEWKTSSEILIRIKHSKPKIVFFVFMILEVCIHKMRNILWMQLTAHELSLQPGK